MRGALKVAGGLAVALAGQLRAAGEQQRLRIVAAHSEHGLDGVERTRAVAFIHIDTGQQLARAEVARVAVDERVEQAFGFLRCAQAVVRQRAEHEQLFVGLDVFGRQTVDQPGDFAERFLHGVAVAAAAGQHRAQIGGARLGLGVFSEIVEVARDLGVAFEVEQQRGAGDAGIDVFSVQRQGFRIGRQRLEQIALGVQQRGAQVPQAGVVGVDRHRALDALLRRQDFALLEQEGHQREVGPDGLGIGVDGVAEGLPRATLVAFAGHRGGAHRQHLDPRFAAQPVGVDVAQHVLGPPQRHQQLPARDRNLRRAHAQLERLTEGRFGRGEFGLLEQRTTEQNMRGEHAIVLLQRVLELDDGARGVAALEAGEAVFVEGGGLAGVAGDGMEAEREAQGEHGTMQMSGGRAKRHEGRVLQK